MRDAHTDLACGVGVALNPVLTRQLQHPVFIGDAQGDEYHLLIAEALSSGEWEILEAYGMFPKWVFAASTRDPLKVAEFRFDVMLLHVFESVEARDRYLDHQELDLFADLSRFVRPEMPQKARSSSPHDFKVGDFAPTPSSSDESE